MMEGINLTQIAVIALIALAVGCATFFLLAPLLAERGPEAKLRTMAADRKAAQPKKQSAVSRLVDGQKDNRRRQVQESLKNFAELEKKRKKGLGLRVLIIRAGLRISVRRYWVAAGLTGLSIWFICTLLGTGNYIAILGGIAGVFGLPRWFLGFLASRRQKAFLADLADAIDVMVRGLKAGLPLSDAMRIIATESPPPLGPEFLDVVEGQRVGITIEQGIERMFERMPLPEVNFLGIAIGIQAKSGGNLSEALGNLSKVLRERKKMKAKIRSLSQEAKTSAIIIGSIPFFLIAALLFLNPDYMTPLFSTTSGNLVLAGSAIWMSIGIVVMRKMINFEV
ncbi:type II secretion system F family protein [Aestuariivirga sp.]|uniref:type II secretion system F family protein n=1 Tax=Aestuariivirga sp. TaxID=2650926 RepID=UPI003BA979F9